MESTLILLVIIAILTLIIFYRFCSYQRDELVLSKDDLKDRIVIITGGDKDLISSTLQSTVFNETLALFELPGTSSGIGKHLAHQLILHGATVVGGCRTSVRTGKDGGTNFEELFLDLSSFESVLDFYERVSTRHHKVDILINNAAYMGPKKESSDGHDYSFQVNYLSHYLLTLLFIGRHFDAGENKSRLRVINVTSDIVGRARSLNNYDVTPLTNREEFSIVAAYANTKVCLVLFADEIHKRFHRFGVSAMSIHPGRAKSDLQKHWPGFRGAVLRFVSFFFLSPTDLAATNILQLCALKDDERFSGEMFHERKLMRDLAGCPQRNLGNAKSLWELSLTMIPSLYATKISSNLINVLDND